VSALELASVVKVRGAGHHAVRALDGVSLRVEAGELVLLQGPSGSGKTTLLAVAAGLLGADAGEVVLDGHALGREGVAGRRRLRARRVGFVFQRSNLLPRLTALENVALQAALAGIPPAEAQRRALAVLEQLGLAGLAARQPESLSGGEEQRVAVARALVHAPALVLADEPTASLDGASGRAVVDRLLWSARELGAAVLVATHDPRLEPCATRRVRIADGRLEGEPR